MSKGVVARFWSKVDDSGGPDACWEFVGSRSQSGYGQFWNPKKKKNVRAHRFAWRIANGAIPPGMHVLHACDNPPCVNPAHLWIGTHQDNMQDMQEKGRTNPPEGSDNGFAKLSECDVLDIRNRVANGEHRNVVADAYGVTSANVGLIVTGRAWKHVGGPIEERKPATRLTPSDVRDIRWAVYQGVSQSDLCDAYELSPATVSEIVRGKSWKQAGGPVLPTQRGGNRARQNKRRRERYERDFGTDKAVWIRTLPCLVCGTTPVEACHAKSRGAGGTSEHLLPMCHKHHREQHMMGVTSFGVVHGVDLMAEAEHYHKAWILRRGAA